MSALEQINRILNVVAVWLNLLHPHSSRSFAHVYATQGDFHGVRTIQGPLR